MLRLTLFAALVLPVLTAMQTPQFKPNVMRFSVVEQGMNSGVKSKDLTVIRTQLALDAFLKKQKETGAKAYEKTDWKTVQYVAIYGGEAPTGGYGVEIKKVTALGPAEVTIEARLTHPTPGAILTQALTTPYTVIRMPKQLGKVSLKWVTE